MKRKLTLIGSILGTVANAIYTCIAIYSVLILALAMNIAGSQEGGGEVAAVAGFAIVLLVAILVFCVLALIFDAMSISAWNKDAAGYKKKKGIVITSVVFDLLTAVFLLVNFSVLNILFSLVLIAASVLKIVDLANENKKGAEAEKQAVAEQNTTESNTTNEQ